MATGKSIENSTLSGDANLQAHYKFNTGALTTDSANSYTLTNNNSVAEGTGKFGTSADLGDQSGSAKSFSRADGLGISLSGSWTYSFFVYVNEQPATNTQFYLIDHRSTTATARYVLLKYKDTSGTKQVEVNAGGTTKTITKTLTTGQWYHYCVVNNGGSITIYIDGSSIGTSTMGTTANAINKTVIGADTNATGQLSKVQFDDMAIFNRALSLAEVREIALGLNDTDWSTAPYEIQSDSSKVSGSSDLTDFPALISDSNLSAGVYAGMQQVLPLSETSLNADGNLVGYWKFDETSGTSLSDEKSNNTLIATNTSIVGSDGRFNNGLALDNSNYASKSSPSSHLQPSNTQDFSVSFWIKGNEAASGTDYGFLANQHTNSNDAGWWIVMTETTGSLTYFYGKGSPGQNHATGLAITDLLDGEWHNVVITFTGMNGGETIKTYKDGTLVDNKAISGSGSIAYHATMSFFVAKSTACQVDDVAIFTRVLSQAEINEINGDGAVDGADLRITTDSAGTTEIPFEIVSISPTNETCEIWAKVPTLSYNSATSLFIWYGNSNALPYSATDTYGSQNVWSANYQGVYHLGADGSDSTSNGYTVSGATEPTFNTTAKFGKGGSFDGSNDYLAKSDATCPNLEITGSQTWGGWVYHDTLGRRIVAKTLLSQAVNRRDLYVNGSGQAVWIVGGLTTNTSVLSPASSVTTGTWHRIIGVYDSGSSKLKVWVNDTKTEVTASGSAADSNSPFSIGCSHFGTGDARDSFFDGIIEDVIVRNTASTDDWIVTEYNNQNDPSTFWTAVSGFSPKVMFF